LLLGLLPAGAAAAASDIAQAAPAAFPSDWLPGLHAPSALLGAWFGTLSVLLVYHLFLLISTRERRFALFAVHLLGLAVLGIAWHGDAMVMLSPIPEVGDLVLALSAGVTCASFGLFAMRFLDTRHHAPRLLHGTLWALVGLAVLAQIWAGALLVLACFAVGLQRALHGAREGRYIALACAGLIAGALADGFMRTNGHAPAAPVLHVAFVVELLLLAFGLADSMNRLKVDALRAEQTAREAQEQLAAHLEQQVAHRTRALEAANQRLNRLAITDELTGAFNRRHFNALCRSALLDTERVGGTALCMFDLDHFKAYNDHYGHQAGDETLRVVAQAVRSELRRSGDHLFRLGGEEFAVLYSAVDLASAQEAAERLRLAVRGIAREHVRTPAGRVTASFGVVFAGKDVAVPPPEAFYAAADALLYEAKRRGRDVVVAAAYSPMLAPAEVK
jgi:diguanylate cyclase (GGDEF)-like protein